MKTNFQKIFIGLSLSLIFFLGNNFVNAQLNIPQKGGSISNLNTWWNNSSSALGDCTSSSACRNILNVSGYKASRFNEIINKVGPIPSCSTTPNNCPGAAQAVADIQEALDAMGCFFSHIGNRSAILVDGKLGRDTLYDMTHCCVGENLDLPNIDQNFNLSCDNGQAPSPTELEGGVYQICCVVGETISDEDGDDNDGANVDATSNCVLTKDRQSCDNKDAAMNEAGVSVDSSFTGFKEILSLGTGCLTGDNYIPFCTEGCMTWKLLNNTCEADYGSGWYDNDGCCEYCGLDKKLEEGKCVCIENLPCSDPTDWRDPKDCRCKCDPSKKCCGIQLNTVVPFIGDCIELTAQNDPGSSNDPNTSTVNQLNAFPFLMMGLSKILVTVILIFSFLIVIAAGLMMTTGVYSDSNYKKGMEWIQKIVIALILLGSSGLILKLINPSFFGG